MGTETISLRPEWARCHSTLLENRNGGVKENGPNSWQSGCFSTTEEEAEALKTKFIEEQQRIKASRTYQSGSRADPGRAVLLTALVFKRPISTLTKSLAPAVSWALPAVVKEPHPAQMPPVGKVKRMSDVLGQILLVLVGLLSGFSLLTKILKILKSISCWCTSQFCKGTHALCFPKFWTPSYHALVQIFPMDVPMISLDVSQAFYHLSLNPASALQLAISDGKLVYYFQKPPIILVSALFSSIYSQLPSQLNYLVTGIFGLLLVGMTSSSARTSSSYLNSATESAVFLKALG